MALEDARLGQRDREVERGLAAEPGQQALGPLAGDDRLDRLDGQRLEVDDVGDGRVGHDRGRVRVDEDRPDALGAEGAAGLRPGVVELGRLADDDRPGAEDQDRRRLRAGRRQRVRASRAPAAATNRSNTASASSGPGAPSGWYWTVSIGSSRWRRPSTEPSLRLTWLTRKPDAAGSELADDLDLVVLGRHLDEADLEVLDRVVRAVVPEPQPRVSAPAARPTIWWPRQMPSSGRPSSMTARASATWASSRAGSPGPGRQDHAVDVRREDVAGATPCAAGRGRAAPRRRIARTMFALRPKSTIPTSGAAVAPARGSP